MSTADHDPPGPGRPRGRGIRAARLLIVEDDLDLGRALCAAAARAPFDARLCTTIDEARAELEAEGADAGAAWWPELVLVDVCLPDGTALDLLRAFPSTRPRPCIVAMSGAARPEQSFELARSGVRHFLPKPVDSAEEVLAILRRAHSEPPDLAPQIRATVGLRPVQEVEAEVRRVMVGEALVRVGTVRGAARLLAVSRQLLQHIRRSLRNEAKRI